MYGKLARAFEAEINKIKGELFQFVNHHGNRIPVSWSIVEYKEYPRFESVALPRHFNKTGNLYAALSHRESTQNFSETDISLSTLGQLLYYSAGRKGVSEESTDRRHHPSGGAMYPIEAYLLILQDTGTPVKPGLYHYNIKNHALENLRGAEVIDELKQALNIETQVPYVLLMSAVWDRTMKKYQDFGYKLALVEAGHIAQNFILTATSLGLRTWPFMSFDNRKTDQLLGFDKRNEENIIYCIGMGKPTDDTK